jgi:hypothetical protein
MIAVIGNRRSSQVNRPGEAGGGIKKKKKSEADSSGRIGVFPYFCFHRTSEKAKAYQK